MIASVHIFVNFVNQTFYASSHNCKKVLENIIIFEVEQCLKGFPLNIENV